MSHPLHATLGISEGAVFFSKAGSGKNYVILAVSAGYISGTLGAGSIVAATAAQTAAPTGGTPVVPQSCLIGNLASATAKAYSGSTTTTCTLIRAIFVAGAFAAGEAKAKKDAEDEAAEEAGETIKVIDEKVEELVAGDLKLKEDESLPKDVPIKRKTKIEKRKT